MALRPSRSDTFGDLIILPILNIYRKYYGVRMAGFIAVTFYTAMVIAGLTVDLVFKTLGLQRTVRDAKVVEASIHFNYTTVLNIVFLGLAALLVYRFVSTGGTAMLRAMNRPAGAHDEHQIAHGS
jgi:hypothetical protein